MLTRKKTEPRVKANGSTRVPRGSQLIKGQDTKDAAQASTANVRARWAAARFDSEQQSCFRTGDHVRRLADGQNRRTRGGTGQGLLFCCRDTEVCSRVSRAATVNDGLTESNAWSCRKLCWSETRDPCYASGLLENDQKQHVSRYGMSWLRLPLESHWLPENQDIQSR